MAKQRRTRFTGCTAATSLSSSLLNFVRFGDCVFTILQALGPKPIHYYPPNPGPFLDVDQVAVWLMSSENVHGSRVILYNQHMDLHAMVLYVTLLDVTARGFQRPTALAYLSADRPTLQQRTQFHRLSGDLFRRLLSCNRRMFRSYADHIIELSNQLQLHKFRSYYSLSSDSISSAASTKIRQIAKQVKLLLVKDPEAEAAESESQRFNMHFMEVYRMVAAHPVLCDCGKDPKHFGRFIEIMEAPGSAELVPIFELAPCAEETFRNSFASTYEELGKQKIRKGAVFCAGYPVFMSSAGANSVLCVDKSENSDDEDEDIDISRIAAEFRNENSLCSSSSSLVQACVIVLYEMLQCLFPLLAGERIAVLASKQRLCTGVDFTEKLNTLRICRRKETVRWKRNGGCAGTDTQLVGFECAREQSQKWRRPPNISVYIDLNNHRLFAQSYQGRLLERLHSVKHFPSDQSLIPYIVSTVSEAGFISRLGRNLPLELLGVKLKLSDDDLLIMANILAEYDLRRFLERRNILKHSLKKPYHILRISR